MKINELVPNNKVVNLVAVISVLEEPITSTTGIMVQGGVIEDNTGQAALSLWGEQAGAFSIGDKVLISVGWCKSYEGANQVSTGKFGKIKKVPNEPEANKDE